MMCRYFLRDHTTHRMTKQDKVFNAELIEKIHHRLRKPFYSVTALAVRRRAKPRKVWRDNIVIRAIAGNFRVPL
jgi:hypothetical protein